MSETQYRQVGKTGEDIAIQYLLERGYQVLAQNWVCAWGEIDVIATENDRLHLIEVKTRRARTTDEALLNISNRKKQRMLKSAYAYLHHHQQEDCAWQIDIIAIALQTNRPPLLEHIEDALGW
ncbi:MAG: YraN family protein [Phototrophicaceae bacterium]